ncbi:hypothetical protein JRO89_XS06G0103000 [Xanthoceras sorbifolium]|uniref:Gnk2-homologous domain-containing protein n=1 Tax=Xanthoceras sorbifolium TaxID=99658 RepID=A0ABQ8HXK1_9ROSI|nr:hypothetical protein JRO89_XS06G0103000 [Xanthoceras sorbifolium]
MRNKKLVAFFLYHVLTSISLATAQTCYNTGNFTSNSTYGESRNLILSSLAPNVTANEGFYTASVSQVPDKVYALALCRGDTSSESSFRSLNSAVQDIISKCPVEKEAISWGMSSMYFMLCQSLCIWQVEVSPADAGYNVNDITSNFTEYN